MREIKFRAWDKSQNRIIPWEQIRKNFLQYLPNYKKNDAHELMQFTGLKDKNGKEIYEGDVVQEQTVMVGHTGKVFQQSSGEWMVSYKRGSHPLYKPDGYENSMQTHSLQDWTSDSRIVVIDNIYENPELLEVK